MTRGVQCTVQYDDIDFAQWQRAFPRVLSSHTAYFVHALDGRGKLI